jgi:NAD+ kinase
MRIALYGRLVKETDKSFYQRLFHFLNGKQVELYVYDQFLHALKEASIDVADSKSFHSNQDLLAAQTDLLFSLGGDGTLLDTLALVRDTSIPVLGINAGRLGFLAGVGREDLEQALTEVLNGQYSLDKRALLEFDSDQTYFGDQPFALNEFTIHKKDASSMITIHTFLNGELLASYWADGLIVCTPTGSTAYSLSCGGPILVPTSDNFVITPVAPHNLNIRPIVVPGNSIITFEVEGRNDQILCTLDARVATVAMQVPLAIRKAQHTISLVRLHETHFLQTMRNKLNWGRDERN